MVKKLFLLFFLIFCINLAFADDRALYVDGFSNILGSPTKEDKLLKFAEKYSFNTLMLYDLNKVDKRFSLTDPRKNNVLAEFISKARLKFGINHIGAIGEAASFFINRIHVYNTSRNKIEEKFDIYNLEYEYWSNKASGDGGYYCINYLEENQLACGRKSSFQFFLNNLKKLKELALESDLEIKTEAYVSYYTTNEINEISKVCDKIVVRAFGNSPKMSFASAKKNLENLLKTKSRVSTSILFSTKITNLGRWLKYDSLERAESLFLREMNIKNGLLEKYVNLVEFSYHTFSDLEKSTSYYSYSKN